MTAALTDQLRAALAADPGSRVLDDDGEPTGRVNMYAPWVEATPGDVDGEALTWYRHGHCVLLALTLHDLTGWPLLLLESGSEKGWSHAVVRAPSGLLLDIAGEQPAAEVVDYFRRWSPTAVVEVSRAEFVARCTDGDPYGHNSAVELAVTADFAWRLATAAGWEG